MTANVNIKGFLQQYGAEYPYCDTFKTRSRFYAPWLLVKRARYAGFTVEADVRRDGVLSSSWMAIPSSVFSSDTVASLVLSKEALPATPDMSSILDVMH